MTNSETEQCELIIINFFDPDSIKSKTQKWRTLNVYIDERKMIETKFSLMVQFLQS